jgi:5-methylthioadenosine/S-adenosylhomocysteine deaminase
LNCDSPGMFPINYAAGAAVMGGEVSRVETVIVGGEILKRDGVLVGVDLPALRREAEASRDRLVARSEASAGRQL